MQKFGDSVDVDEVDDGEDEFSFPAGDSFAVGEEFAAFVVDVLFELGGMAGTVSKGE